MRTIVNMLRTPFTPKDPLRLPFSRREGAEWDRLWIRYYEREPIQLALQSEMRRETLPSSRDEAIDDVYFFVHCDRSALEGKTVLEVGSGSGYFAKLVAHHTKLYIGIDWSGLALRVSRRTCPVNAEWIHAGDVRALRAHAGRVDTVIARNFIIHQNAERLRRLLSFEYAMLRPRGRTYLDFWLDNFEIGERPGVWPAKTSGKVPPNAVYRYTEAEIRQIADEARFNVVEMNARPDKLRNFVVLEK